MLPASYAAGAAVKSATSPERGGDGCCGLMGRTRACATVGSVSVIRGCFADLADTARGWSTLCAIRVSRTLAVAAEKPGVAVLVPIALGHDVADGVDAGRGEFVGAHAVGVQGATGRRAGAKYAVFVRGAIEIAPTVAPGDAAKVFAAVLACATGRGAVAHG